MPRTDDIEYQAYPRVCALAELTWTAPERRADTEEFMTRLAEHGARLTALGLNHRRVAPPASLKWSPGFLSAATSWMVPVPDGLTEKLKNGATLKLHFQYQSGAHGLDIQAVELLSDGQAVAADRHAGFTGGQPRQPDYQLALPKDAKPGKLHLRIAAKGSGGNDSQGEIQLSADT